MVLSTFNCVSPNLIALPCTAQLPPIREATSCEKCDNSGCRNSLYQIRLVRHRTVTN
jgi:hypothetical protein